MAKPNPSLAEVSAYAERTAVVFEIHWPDYDLLLVATLFDVAGRPGIDAEAAGAGDNFVGVVGRDVEGETAAHVEVAVHLLESDPTMLLNEAENRLLYRFAVDDVHEWLDWPHQLAPAVTGDVDGVMEIYPRFLAVLDDWHVDDRGIEQSLPKHSAVAECGIVAH